MSTTIDPNPTSAEASALRDWVQGNVDKLNDCVAHQLKRIEDLSRKNVTPVATIAEKTATDVTPDTRFWVNITIPNPQEEDVVAYIGCATCSKRCDYFQGSKFMCVHCGEEKLAELKNNFTFVATDRTGSIRFTAFGEECAKLLRSTTTELLEKKKQETWPEFTALAATLQSKASLIQVGPAGTIKRSGVLKWYVKAVSLEQ
uniref:Replication factor A C-terminal domain-containing protein n=1 Tax=Chenopodium quinoa TaxID=63459 RepID=A0A803MQS9_CHEQI